MPGKFCNIIFLFKQKTWKDTFPEKGEKNFAGTIFHTCQQPKEDKLLLFLETLLK